MVPLRSSAIPLIAALLSGPAHGQAWLPERGSLSLSAIYNNYLNKEHYDANGDEIDLGHTRTQSLVISGSYGLTDRLMITGDLPYVATRYRGEYAHPYEVDNGHYHATVTDAILGAHYQALEEPLALAPFVAVVIPTHDYDTLGHAAPGQGVWEVWLGSYAGMILDPWLPRSYVQVRYNYAFVEKVEGVSHNRSNAELEIGYFLTPRWSIRAIGTWQDTYDGVDLPVPIDDPLYEHHDQLAAEDVVNVGAGLAYSASPRWSVYGLWLQSVWGKNAHKVDSGLTLGISYLVR